VLFSVAATTKPLMQYLHNYRLERNSELIQKIHSERISPLSRENVAVIIVVEFIIYSYISREDVILNLFLYAGRWLGQ
jgi:hypothetical protein